MKNRIFRFYFKGWRFVIANCPVKVKKHRNEMTGWERRRLKAYIYKRADGLCECCGKALEENDIEMHHIAPVCLAPELSKNKDNLLCLCTACHRRIHSNPFANTRIIAIHNPEYAKMLAQMV